MTINPHGYGPLMMGVSWAAAGLGTVVFLARTYTSWIYTKRFRADYWTSLLTYVLALSSLVFLTISINDGFGTHISLLTPHGIAVALHMGWIAMILAIIGTVTGKISIIAFLDQVRGHQQSRPWLLWFIALSNILVNGVVVVLILTQCSPYQKLWDERIEGNCNGRKLNQHYAYFQGSWSAVSDVALALYPITIIWGLQMALRLKIGLCVLMSFGILAAVCSAIKTAQLTTLGHTDDVTYFIARLALVTVAEGWIILIVGCVPPLRALMKAVFNKARGTSQRSTYINHPSHYGRGRISNAAYASHGHAPSNGNVTRAYHSGSADDAFELHGANDSKESIVKDSKGIIMTTDVHVQYEGRENGMASEDSSDATTVFDRV